MIEIQVITAVLPKHSRGFDEIRAHVRCVYVSITAVLPNVVAPEQNREAHSIRFDEIKGDCLSQSLPEQIREAQRRDEERRVERPRRRPH